MGHTQNITLLHLPVQYSGKFEVCQSVKNIQYSRTGNIKQLLAIYYVV